jgi:hypothetical protein
MAMLASKWLTSRCLRIGLSAKDGWFLDDAEAAAERKSVRWQ